MRALLIATAVLAMALPASARAPNSGADYFQYQQEKLLEHMESSIRPKANPRYPTIYSSSRPVRAPWYED